MSLYINKKTLKVLETDDLNKYKGINSDWVEYPYDDYEPEKYELSDFWHIDHIFNISRSVRESITDLDCYYEKLIEKYPQYDYIAFCYYPYEDSYTEIIHQLKPYGCYHPTEERALKWYKEQKADVERQKERSRKNLDSTINDLTKRLEEAKKHREELDK